MTYPCARFTVTTPGHSEERDGTDMIQSDARATGVQGRVERDKLSRMFEQMEKARKEELAKATAIKEHNNNKHDGQLRSEKRDMKKTGSNLHRKKEANGGIATPTENIPRRDLSEILSAWHGDGDDQCRGEGQDPVSRRFWQGW